MAAAAEAGVDHLDTPPVEDSVSLVYIGTDNYSAGYVAGQVMAQVLPEGGKIGVGRGSDTALNALQRTDGFIDALAEAEAEYEILEPVNDREDAGTALQLANSVISANPDLAGAFGVYAYNGPAWATALGENDKVGEIKLVCFDATTDIINFIKDGTIQASIAQREYDMGYKSVMMLYNMAVNGVEAALEEAGVVDGVLTLWTSSPPPTWLTTRAAWKSAASPMINLKTGSPEDAFEFVMLRPRKPRLRRPKGSGHAAAYLS